ncbi:MAG: hypothetical protein SFU98_02550 [Leptospiraceae bacterium]|nr:hypothetical protein [Leptospiraceae bacterium]
MDAALLANQNKIWICHFFEQNKFGYLVNRIYNHEIQANINLSQAEWQKSHSKIEESGSDFMRGSSNIHALILDEKLQKKYDFKNLEFALPFDLSSKNLFYTFELPNYYLKITDLENIPIFAINFRYYTELKEVNSDNLVQALGEVLSIYILG